jgi:hypothetical protein
MSLAPFVSPATRSGPTLQNVTKRPSEEMALAPLPHDVTNGNTTQPLAGPPLGSTLSERYWRTASDHDAIREAAVAHEDVYGSVRVAGHQVTA